MRNTIKPCPLGLPIYELLEYIASEDYCKAMEFLRDYIPFPGITGCMCKNPCFSGFTDSVPPISEFEHFLYEYELENFGFHRWDISKAAKSHKHVAIVGAGPAGLSAAYKLLRLGHDVTVFDRYKRPGGMLNLAILPSQLPRHVLFSELDILNKLGITFKMSKPIMEGAPTSLRNLRVKYDAVFLATGAHKVRKISLPGIDTGNVISVLEMFERINNRDRFPMVKNVTVLGDGNDAIGAAITLTKMKKNVSLMHLKKLDNMTADKRSISQAINAGVEFLFMHMPLRILSAGGRIKAIETERLSNSKLGKDDFKSEGGHIYKIESDMLVIAQGRYPYTEKIFGEDIKTTKRKFIKIDENFSTGIDGIYAGGDCIDTTGGYIYAVSSGKNAAMAISRFLSGEDSRKLKQNKVPALKDKQINIEISDSKSFLKVESTAQAKNYARIILDIINRG